MKYVLFLRGINVGGLKMTMADLRSSLSRAGLTDIVTVLQTGNVLFHTDDSATSIIPRIRKALREDLGYEATIFMYTQEHLKNLAQACPYSSDEQVHRYILFCDDPAVQSALITAAQVSDATQDQLTPGTGVIYWRVPIGHTLDTPFAKLIAQSQFRSHLTNRNLKTLEKLTVL